MSTEWSKWLYVAPSSVTPAGGLGLYAAVNIRRGTLLPGCYSGVYITSTQYGDLLQDLERPPSHSGTRRFIEYLEATYKLKIRPSSGESKGSRRETPQWKAISKGVSDYAFEGESSADKTVTVTILPVYNYQGAPVFDQGKPDNPYMLMNEPPPVKQFYNLETKQMQPSIVNVHPVLPSEISGHHSSSPALRFRARENIKADDELFICYGAQYERPYDINMSTTCGCGQYDEVAGNLAPGVTRKKYHAALEEYHRVPSSVLASDSAADKRIREYFKRIVVRGSGRGHDE